MRLTSDLNLKLPNYVSFRDEFLNQVTKSGLNHLRSVMPGSGWQGEALSQDFAYMDQGSETTLVHLCGMHGIEGYLGSSIQQKILSTYAQGIQDSKVNIIFVHAVNPFGMSWYRRANHNNIDLNRNGLSLTKPAPPNIDVLGFADFLESSSYFDLLKKSPAVIKEIFRLGIGKTTQAVAGGQWEFPESLFYGGKTVQPELQNLLVTLPKLAPKTKQFYVIDVHSGLGPWTYDSLYVSYDQHRQMDFFHRSTEEETQESHVIDMSPNNTKQLYFTYCTAEDLLTEELKNHEISYVTQEFGTYNFAEILRSLIFENSLFKNDPKATHRPEILLKTFFPNSQQWQASCRQAGLKRFSQIHQALQAV